MASKPKKFANKDSPLSTQVEETASTVVEDAPPYKEASTVMKNPSE